MTQVGQARGISVLRTPPRLRLECENGTMTKLVDSCGECFGAAMRSSVRADAETATRSGGFYGRPSFGNNSWRCASVKARKTSAAVVRV